MSKPLLATLLLGLLSVTSLAAKTLDYGTGADMSKLERISTVLDKPEDYMGKTITVKGTITAVCEKRGCWMKLASDKRFQTLRIKVKDGDMVFPLSAKGRTAYATGTLDAIPLNKQQAIDYLAHMAKEAKEDFDPASVTDGMTLYQLVPAGVTIAD